MGGGPKMAYPAWVWTPTGGYYTENTKWRRNTALAGVAIGLGAYLVFKLGTTNERRSVPARPIRSQKWATHTKYDDPEYFKKYAEYQKTKPSVLSRILPD
mmetsp:Transcript_20461/g.30420  ORF Transcript_20461/g.30420 Transcript_20461/m.30420 type:complete len:100 (-) Transcript_20461:43-342(-)